MDTGDPTPEEAMLEECLDELDTVILRLTRFPATVVAVALRMHLEVLLQTLLEARLCTSGEVREFVRELERQTLVDF